MRPPVASLGLLAVLAGVAGAQPVPRPAPPAPARIIAVAPLTALGTEDTSTTARAVEAAIATALATEGGGRVITGPEVVDATKRAKKPQLRACDGGATCLAELGGLVGAHGVVFGELGGLGDVQVLSLGLVDVPTGKEVRRVQVSLAQPEQGGVPGAVVRLMAPERYVGQLVVTTAVAGASIYIDGKRVAKSPSPPIRMAVGAHALRVTHPEHRDYVRFVDIAFGTDLKIDLQLEKFASIESSVESTARPTPTGPVRYVDAAPRWYRQWWAVAGVAAIALGGAMIIGGTIDHAIDHNGKGTVEPPQ